MDTYPEFDETNGSLLKKHLTRQRFEALKHIRTDSGTTLADIIRSGIENPDSAVGIYAGDDQSYTAFQDLFDPVIRDYHSVKGVIAHRKKTPVNLDDIPSPDPDGIFVQSFRIRTGRNLTGFALPSKMRLADRQHVEQQIVTALLALTDDLEGKYYPLDQMTPDEKASLIGSHILFKENDRFLGSAGITNHWPQHRGIFMNHDKSFFVWVNEEDQLRMIALDFSSNIINPCKQFFKAVAAIETKLNFIFSPKYGYITSCPTNIGTAIRASVHIRLPNCSTRPALLKQTASDLNLQVRGKDGEHSQTHSDIFDISNKRRLGVSEQDCLVDLCSGIKKIIALEQRL